jgi:glutamate dehydrogenase (NAD(P)+)
MRAEDEVFGYSDELGPEKVLYVYDPKVKLKGILVVDNTAIGPAIGGIRMAPNVTTEEVFRLARAMTLKNSAAGLRHGGGKGGIVADPSALDKNDLIRSYARAIGPIADYIPGPDMGTDERSMAIILDEIGRAVGLPRELGGIPLDEIGATGYGVAVCTEVACRHLQVSLSGATVAIEGFGAVGKAAVRFLTERGARVVAVSDSKGATYNPAGLSLEDLLKAKAATGSVKDCLGGKAIPGRDLFGLKVDILVPGARPDVITEDNAADVQAKIVVEAANIPATVEAERIMHNRGVLVIPDFIANAGGVIAAAVEYAGGTISDAMATIGSKVAENTQSVLEVTRARKITPREAAEEIAKDRVLKAMKFRGRI